MILIILRVKNYISEDVEGANNWDPDLYLTVTAEKSNGLDLDTIIGLVEKNSFKSRLKRADVSGTNVEVLFVVELTNANDPHVLENELRKIDKEVVFTLLEAA